MKHKWVTRTKNISYNYSIVNMELGMQVVDKVSLNHEIKTKAETKAILAKTAEEARCDVSALRLVLVDMDSRLMAMPESQFDELAIDVTDGFPELSH